ncbi:MAG: cytochrome-c peroxidase [Alphaproteobacteria bacterium]|nr:cytochrome-c peroxidase [Alphaproteobacteria bacterium]
MMWTLLACTGSAPSPPPPDPPPSNPSGLTPYVVHVPAHVTPMPVPADNPLTVEGVALGRYLFYDPLLSGDDDFACASCHLQRYAFTDGLPRAVGTYGEPVQRNTMALINLAWEERFFWEGRASTLEEQVLIPIQDPRELAQDLPTLLDELRAHPDYPARFQAAFPGQPLNEETLAKALAQFVRALVSFDAPIDRLRDDAYALSPLEQRGTDLLSMTLPQGDPDGVPDLCNECHDQHRGVRQPAEADMMGLFSDARFRNSGLEAPAVDPGREAVTGDPADRGRFRVPTIRNIAVTGPYMHDGRFATLEEVLHHYNEHLVDSGNLDPLLQRDGAPLRLNLSDDDIAAMVAALKLFTDEGFLTDPRFSDPYR